MSGPMQQWMPMSFMPQIDARYEQQVASQFSEVTTTSTYDPVFSEAAISSSISQAYTSLLLGLTPQEIADSSCMLGQVLPSVDQFQSIIPPIERTISRDTPNQHGLEFDYSAQIKRKVKPNGGSKRNPDALVGARYKRTQVYSEKRRRERIREKMKLLHQLLPHPHKSGAAEVLDEAIRYIKALRFHLEIMSISGGIIPVQEDHVSRTFCDATRSQSMPVVPPPLTSLYAGGFPLLTGGCHMMNPAAPLQTPLQIPCTTSNTSNNNSMFYFQLPLCNNQMSFLPSTSSQLQ